MKRTLLAGAVAAALTAATGTAATGTAVASTTHAGSAAPVIHESFTALPCTGSARHRTTLQLEGCAEHQVLRSDKTIDGLARTIDRRLTGAGRSEFVTASRDWLSYRNAECRAASSPEAGGTEAAVVDAQCLATEDGAHVTALRTFLQDAFPAGPRAVAHR